MIWNLLPSKCTSLLYLTFFVKLLCFIFFSEILGTQDIAPTSPYVESSCHNNLCKINTGYYDSVNNNTVLFLSTGALTTVHLPQYSCVEFVEVEGIFCDIDKTNNRLMFSSPYIPRLTLRLNGTDAKYEMLFYIKRVNESLQQVVNYVEPLYPMFGTIATGKFHLEFKAIVKNDDKCTNMVDAIGLLKMGFNSSTNHISTIAESYQEPGSWFVTYTPCEDAQATKKEKKKQKQKELTMIASYGYVEHVMPSEGIINERTFRNPSDKDYNDYSILAPDQSCPVKRDARIHVCYWGPNSIDGQRGIWLNQIKHMNPKEFRFSYIVARTAAYVSDGQDVEDVLSSYSNVEVYPSPFNDGNNEKISIADHFLEAEGLPKGGGPQQKDLYEFFSKRLRAVSYDARKVSPSWARNVYYMVLNTIQPLFCDILVYGNERGRPNDILLTDIGKVLGFMTVSELLNLFPSDLVVPNYFIGPSKYAVAHKSVQDMLSAVYARGEKVPQRFIISPGVDVKKFDGKRTDLVSIRHKGCTGVEGCLVVGFLGRLAPEKNPGLFVMAAETILLKNPFVRFTIIGDGELKDSLVDLTHRLGIAWSFEFMGWVSHDKLPRYLKAVDILVNPSLRAWSETFCTSNIEAMAMNIPLVTFGVGGVGEYVSVAEDYYSTNHSQTSYSIVNNAVLINRAHPTAIVDAVELLIGDPLLRGSLGAKGREMVEEHFSLELQMKQYTSLYRMLASQKNFPAVPYAEKVKDFFSPKKNKK